VLSTRSLLDVLLVQEAKKHELPRVCGTQGQVSPGSQTVLQVLQTGPHRAKLHLRADLTNENRKIGSYTNQRKIYHNRLLLYNYIYSSLPPPFFLPRVVPRPIEHLAVCVFGRHHPLFHDPGTNLLDVEKLDRVVVGASKNLVVGKLEARDPVGMAFELADVSD
jgi:hypothetical protein